MILVIHPSAERDALTPWNDGFLGPDIHLAFHGGPSKPMRGPAPPRGEHPRLRAAQELPAPDAFAGEEEHAERREIQLREPAPGEQQPQRNPVRDLLHPLPGLARILAEAVAETAEEPGDFRYLYPDHAPLRDKIHTIATRIYGAADVHYHPAASRQLDRYLDERGAGGKRYTQAGLRVLDTLFDDAGPYLSRDAKHQGLVLHSVYHRPNGWDYVPEGRKVPCGESSMWGDYHARELALYVQRLAEGGTYYTFFGPTSG